MIENLESITRTSSEILACPVIEAMPLKKGGNNKLFRIKTAENFYALKQYKQDENDLRDRYATETMATQFMQDNGIVIIPKFISGSPKSKLAIYEWIPGTQIEKPTIEQIDHAINFIETLRLLQKPAQSCSTINLASESCLSIKEIITQTEFRLTKLELVIDKNLQDFLNLEMTPALIEAKKQLKQGLQDYNLLYEEQIAPNDRIISPSDFGFHNALQLNDLRTFFLDFEYFGWDDPTKLAADFALHPGMNLSNSQVWYFIEKMIFLFQDLPNFERRLKIVMPLYALRWCTILLNKYLHNYDQLSDEILENQRQTQLGKARKMLCKYFDYQKNSFQ